MPIRAFINKVSTLVLASVLAVGVGVVTVSLTTASRAEAAIATEVKVNDTVVSATAGCTPDANSWCLDTDGTLKLNGGNISSIAATGGDLILQLFASTTVDAPANTDAINVTGNLTVVGSGSTTLTIKVATSSNAAIQLSGGSTLTVGDGTDAITVDVQSGAAPQTAVLPGPIQSSYTTPSPTPPPGPESTCAPTPLTVAIGDVEVITAGALSGTVTDVTVEYVGPTEGGFWSVSFKPNQTYGALSITGTDTPFISTTTPGTVTIQSANGLSVNATNCAGVLFIGEGSSFILEGGIYSDNDSPQGAVKVDSAVVQIGSSETGSARGIEAPMLDVYNQGAMATIFMAAATEPAVTPPALSGITGTPNLPIAVSLSQGAKLTVDTPGTATANMESVTVSRAAVFDVVHGGAVDAGTPFELLSEVLPTNSGQVCLDPGVMPQPSVTSVGSSDSDDFEKDRAKLASTASSFVFSSLSTITRNFEWLEGSSGDAVTGGAVCVLASQGTARVDDGPFGRRYTFEIEENSDVTIKLLPQHEFQFLSGEFEASGPPQPLATGIFGAAVATIPVNPEAGAAEYSFTMPTGDITLSTVFEPVPDSTAIITGTTDVTAGSISGAPEAINGNAQLTIGEGAPTDATEFGDVAGTRTVASYLDVSVDQIIAQGNTGGEWTQPLTELPEPVSVSLQLDTALQGFSEYQVIREHNGVVEAVPTTYDTTSATLTFETDKFSTYAIAHGPKVANPNTYDEGSDWQIAGMIGSLAGLIVIGSTYLIRRRYPIG